MEPTNSAVETWRPRGTCKNSTNRINRNGAISVSRVPPDKRDNGALLLRADWELARRTNLHRRQSNWSGIWVVQFDGGHVRPQRGTSGRQPPSPPAPVKYYVFRVMLLGGYRERHVLPTRSWLPEPGRIRRGRYEVSGRSKIVTARMGRLHKKNVLTNVNPNFKNQNYSFLTWYRNLIETEVIAAKKSETIVNLFYYKQKKKRMIVSVITLTNALTTKLPSRWRSIQINDR